MFDEEPVGRKEKTTTFFRHAERQRDARHMDDVVVPPRFMPALPGRFYELYGLTEGFVTVQHPAVVLREPGAVIVSAMVEWINARVGARFQRRALRGRSSG